VNKEDDPDAMDPTALYYALSTIAQCAAALAALIGFLGLWRLQQLREERDHLGQALRTGLITANVLQAWTFTIEAVVSNARRIGERPYGEAEQQAKPQLDSLVTRWDALPDREQRLMGELSRFLILTLAIVVVAIVLVVFADVLSARAWTWWAVKVVVVLAGLGLGVGPFRLVREAVRSTRTLLILGVLLTLASPALAGAVRCTTYEEKTLGRLQTLCDDGTRAVSTWSPTLQQWTTTVTPPPGQRYTGRLNPKSRQWEGRCR
jgi:hypothetical protein